MNAKPGPSWKSIVLLFLATLSVVIARPNIVVVYADDLGWKDPSYQGHPTHETPRLDQLAAEAMVFQAAYAGAGNCAPSRACLHSGTYTPRHGVYAVGSTTRGPKASQRLIAVPNRSGLPEKTLTLAEVLRGAGYATGLFGKWHLDGPEGAQPADQGFDVVFDPRHPNPNLRRDEPDDPKGAFSITRAALEFMKRSRAEEKPFFAFVSHHAIHSTLEARPATLERFERKTPRKKAALYAACLADLDTSLGILLDALDREGMARETMVVFTSDNGATNESSQEPLRGNKGGYYEGGIRVPMVIRWPGKIEPGSRCGEPVHQVDLFPTFLAAAGIPWPEKHLMDGADLAPLFAGEPFSSRALFWHFPGYLDSPVRRGRPSDVDLGFRTRPVSVIRRGPWKLHLFHEEWLLDGGRASIPGNGAVELYHLGRDEGERKDLAADESAKRDELLDELLLWLDKVDAPLPKVRETPNTPLEGN
ncbi:MAG: sulfatase [Akkermansiaceae bacterium]|jgi:arylsulfatase A-like enzyme|nr:sulfatase [Akkermansiaceae bacterium]